MHTTDIPTPTDNAGQAPEGLPAKDGSKVFVVVAYRWGLRDAHSYVVGTYSNQEAASNVAHAHTEYRGGKYGCEVLCCATDNGGEDGNAGDQLDYVESPYFGLAGRSNGPAYQPADSKRAPLSNASDQATLTRPAANAQPTE